jgi:hypothetical protein
LFFLLNNIYSSSNIKIFLFSPLKSWINNNYKTVKSIKKRIKKKIIKVEK